MADKLDHKPAVIKVEMGAKKLRAFFFYLFRFLSSLGRPEFK